MATTAKPPIRSKPQPMSKPNGLAGGVMISKDQLKSTKLKQINSFKDRENNNNNNNNNNNDQKPEFLNVALKSRAPKEAAQGNPPAANSSSAGMINSTPPRAAKKPSIVKKPPTDDELKVKPPDDKKNQDQLKYMKDKKMISESSVSVRNSKFLFEQNIEKATSLERRRRTPSKNSSGGDSFTDSQNGGSFRSQNSVGGSFTSDSGGDVKNEKVAVVPDVTPTPNNEDDEQDTYDDVSEITKNLNVKPLTPQPTPIEEDLYEDVASSLSTPQRQTLNVRPSERSIPPPTSPIRNSTLTQQLQVKEEPDQELYDDISTAAQPQQPAGIEEDFYEDVATSLAKPPVSDPPRRPTIRAPLAPPPASATPLANSADKITPNDATKLHAPIKLEKEFKISDDRLVAPYGLEDWLKATIAANLTRLNGCFLKRNVDELRNSTNNSTNSSISPNTSTIPLEEDDTYADVDQIAMEASNIMTARSPTPGESEKDRLKREKKEKAALEKKEKAEEKKRKEEEKVRKEEKKKREKDLRNFGLSSEIPFAFTGAFMCQSEFTTKEKNHLSYQTCDEIKIIEVKKNYIVRGKMVALNGRDGKVGYVLKSDFGIEEEAEASPEMAKKGGRPVSLIATDDNETQELYEFITPQPGAPPPVPATPRPSLPPPAQPETEELYEEL